ncbi:MAG TPA: hypothetical protein VJU87_00405 [Gemmatimonadaceae bacterium]|nr:hypothetical protein [Gemmatimonadaceae bacterium]
MRRAPALALLGVVLASGARAGAQTVFQVEGGGNSVTGGYGSRVQFWSGAYEGWVGAGYSRGWRLGAFVKHPLGLDTVRVGLDVQPLGFATDIFSGGSYLLTQGLSWRRKRQGFDATIFGGAVGTGAGAPFVNTSRAEKPLGFALVEYRPMPSLLLQSHAVAARRQSFLETAAWTSADAVHSVAATGGVGANAPFGALTWRANSEHVELRAGYTEFGNGFRRADAPAPDFAEPYHESLLLTLRAPRRASVTIGHQNFRQDDSTAGVGGTRAAVDQALTTVALFGVTLGGGVFRTSTPQGHTLSTFNSINRALPFGTSGSLLLLQTFAPTLPPIRTVQAELHEPVTHSLMLSQLFAQTGRSFSGGLGGRYQHGFTTIALDYQNFYVPLRQPDPFMRALTLTIRLQLGNSSASIGTAVDPFGHVTYSASGSTYLYVGEMAPGVQPITIRFERYVIRGYVQDENGHPVDGAALDVGGELALTNSRGEFFVRTKTRRSVPLRVSFDDFLAIGSYELLSAPATVTPEDEEHATAVRILLRSAPPAPTAAPPRPRGPTGMPRDTSSTNGIARSSAGPSATRGGRPPRGASPAVTTSQWASLTGAQCQDRVGVLGNVLTIAARSMPAAPAAGTWRIIERPLPIRP